MWKDYFYFSKAQRAGIISLLVIILLVLLANILLPYLVNTTDNKQPEVLQQETAAFKRQMVSVDSLRKAQYEKLYAEKYFHKSEKRTFENSYSLFAFDPNQTDSATFIRLGLRTYVISNILKFRKRGGQFKTPESFSKVYGLTPEKFNELAPYISIAEQKVTKPEIADKQPATSVAPSPIVELNQADTTELMTVKGIGRSYAKGIVRFRQTTGGFASIDQLKEIYGMTEDNFQRIKPFCKVNTALIRKININTASVEKLNAHPYISFYQAKAIYELRRKKVRLKSIDELKNLSELTPESLQKLEPYLSFE